MRREPRRPKLSVPKFARMLGIPENTLRYFIAHSLKEGEDWYIAQVNSRLVGAKDPTYLYITPSGYNKIQKWYRTKYKGREHE